MLYGECFKFELREYTYEACLFEHIDQIDKNGGKTRLGTWNKWVEGDEVNSSGIVEKRKSQFYDKGINCWNGPDRSVKVIRILIILKFYLKCGSENKLIDVKEPSKCEYTLLFETPLACDDIPIEESNEGKSEETDEL